MSDVVRHRGDDGSCTSRATSRATRLSSRRGRRRLPLSATVTAAAAAPGAILKYRFLSASK